MIGSEQRNTPDRTGPAPRALTGGFMEIERKYKVDRLPAGYGEYPARRIEQAYLCTSPVVRIRREEEDYYLTYKSHGLLAREEYNLPLTQEAYEHLLPKADGIVLTKVRYRIPLAAARGMEGDAAAGGGVAEDDERTAVVSGGVTGDAGTTATASTKGPGDGAAASANDGESSDAGLTVELDVFSGKYQGLILAEVEFPTEEAALSFTPPAWFGRDVTFSGEYQNSRLSRGEPVEI